MKKYVNNACRIIGFLLCLVLVMSCLTNISLPFFGNYQGSQSGFLEEKKDSIDVIFLGTSNMFHSINPVIMYSETGITSYDWGSSSQSLNMSYMYLKEALKTQSPKVVCLEIAQIDGNSNKNLYEPGMRWGFTYFPFGFNKLEGIYAQLNKVDFDYLSYLFPILRYKSRWMELTQGDFDKSADTYLKGCNVTFDVMPVEYPEEFYAAQDVEIKPSNIESLEKIEALCAKEGIELVYFKGPNTEIWNDAYAKKMAAYAENKGIPYIDYNDLKDEIGLLMDNDFQDKSHTNVYGQTKVTKHMAEYLKANYDLKDHREDPGENSYDEAVIKLSRRWNEFFLENSDSLYTYMEFINEQPYIILGQINGNPDGNVPAMLRQYVGATEDSVAFVIDIEKGEALFEANEKPYSWHSTVDGRDLAFEHRKIPYEAYQNAEEEYENEYSRAYNGHKYIGTGYGVSLLVYDKVLGKVVSIAEFDAAEDYRKREEYPLP